ncbi:hypothetical protein RIF29_29427 [Crotalaria pallida]|uniref:Uncharacterized protein n=1 Tax=Crotalaria pallida TaxID=3830 RepID=A0AAN9HTW9_CROPI
MKPSSSLVSLSRISMSLIEQRADILPVVSALIIGGLTATTFTFQQAGRNEHKGWLGMNLLGDDLLEQKDPIEQLDVVLDKDERDFVDLQKKVQQQQLVSLMQSCELDPRIVIHYGIPSAASLLAFDPIQRLLAIATLDGKLKVIGGDSIEGLLVSPKQFPYKYLEVGLCTSQTDIRNVGDEYGLLSVIKFEAEEGKLLKSLYHLSAKFLREAAGLSDPSDEPIVGILSQPSSGGNRQDISSSYFIY